MTIIELVEAAGGIAPKVTPLSLVIATALALLGPAAAAAAAINAFRQRKWRRYRNFSLASCLGSIAGIAVIGYILFLGRGATFEERAARVLLSIAVGAFQCLTLATSVIVAAIGATRTEWRTDENRAENTQVGRPMLAVFAVILLAFLTVAIVSVETSALR